MSRSAASTRWSSTHNHGSRNKPSFLLADEAAGTLEDRAPHGPREAAGVGVLAAGMVGVHQHAALRQPVLGAVAERELTRSERQASKDRVVGDSTQRQDRDRPSQVAQLRIQIRTTRLELDR